MKFGAWIHSHDDVPLEDLIDEAAASGMQSIRSYWLEYSRQVAPMLRRNNMTLLAGIRVDAEALLADWRSQLREEELAAYFELPCQLEAICVGNELREGGDAFDKKCFSPGLAQGLSHLLDGYRSWMARHGVSAPLTYANEFITFGADGEVRSFTRPLIEACDIVSVNHYPMQAEGWMGTEAFALNALLLRDQQVQDERFQEFEYLLRNVLSQMAAFNKPVFFSETGFPSAVDWRIEGEAAPGKPLYVPLHDCEQFEKAMLRFIGIISRVNREFDERVKALYFYEWRDNLYHNKIWNIENSPIHTAFGLCDRLGKPKLDIRRLLMVQSD